MAKRKFCGGNQNDHNSDQDSDQDDNNVEVDDITIDEGVALMCATLIAQNAKRNRSVWNSSMQVHLFCLLKSSFNFSQDQIIQIIPSPKSIALLAQLEDKEIISEDAILQYILTLSIVGEAISAFDNAFKEELFHPTKSELFHEVHVDKTTYYI